MYEVICGNHVDNVTCDIGYCHSIHGQLLPKEYAILLELELEMKQCFYCSKLGADRTFSSRHNPASVIYVHTKCIPGLNKLIPLHTHKGS